MTKAFNMPNDETEANSAMDKLCITAKVGTLSSIGHLPLLHS